MSTEQTMNVRDRLDDIVARHDLLQHPFYKAWSEGTLPVEAIKAYAREWGAFVQVVPRQWQAHGDFEIAESERHHVELWQNFAQALGTEIGEPEVPGVKALISEAETSTSNPAASLGSLYAFEAQQPKTSTSKLEGLREHYNIDVRGHEYFDVHKDDDQEPALLIERIEHLAPEQQIKAVEACSMTACALWGALSGLYEKYGQPAHA
ncbi:MAG: iron-containing redox enzyme family protein [Fimbriimonadaceae bacterium]|nr:iron-containing redox enzyme family protein [Fimbriimonadaceae bacterium]QYK55254.1 MAG: iron-containing redox enzyme family protein [Fimbriimonadaceae bacterium]